MTEAETRLRRYLRRVDSAIAKDLPPQLIAMEMALVIDMANIVCGPEMWTEIGRRAIEKSRQGIALCQHCDSKVCIERSHPPICEACDARIEAECREIDKQLESDHDSR